MRECYTEFSVFLAAVLQRLDSAFVLCRDFGEDLLGDRIGLTTSLPVRQIPFRDQPAGQVFVSKRGGRVHMPFARHIPSNGAGANSRRCLSGSRSKARSAKSSLSGTTNFVSTIRTMLVRSARVERLFLALD